MDKPFSEMVNYEKQFEALALRGIVFSDRDKEKFKSICDDELKRFDGNAIIGKDIFASAGGWLYQIFSFVQNLFLGFDSNNIGDSFSNAGALAEEKGELNALQQASIRIYQRFVKEGGNFTLAAPLVTGQALSTEAVPEKMDEGLYCQIRSTINLPWGTSSSLGKGRVFDS